jgi:hypothetical protein
MWADILTKLLQGAKFCLLQAFLMNCLVDYCEELPFVPSPHPTLALDPTTKISKPKSLSLSVPSLNKSLAPTKPRVSLTMPSSRGCVGTKGVKPTDMPTEVPTPLPPLLSRRPSPLQLCLCCVPLPPLLLVDCCLFTPPTDGGGLEVSCPLLPLVCCCPPCCRVFLLFLVYGLLVMSTPPPLVRSRLLTAVVVLAATPSSSFLAV